MHELHRTFTHSRSETAGLGLRKTQSHGAFPHHGHGHGDGHDGALSVCVVDGDGDGVGEEERSGSTRTDVSSEERRRQEGENEEMDFERRLKEVVTQYVYFHFHFHFHFNSTLFSFPSANKNTPHFILASFRPSVCDVPPTSCDARNLIHRELGVVFRDLTVTGLDPTAPSSSPSLGGILSGVAPTLLNTLARPRAMRSLRHPVTSDILRGRGRCEPRRDGLYVPFSSPSFLPLASLLISPSFLFFLAAFFLDF